MPYPAKAAANFFISQALQEKSELSPLKLLKLIYIAQGWYLALSNEDLIDEPIQAWQFGPVVESVYHEFKCFGNKNITHLAKEYGLDSDGDFDISIYEIPKKDKMVNVFLKKVWDIYKQYTAVQLVNWTHLRDSPWYKAWFEEGGVNKKNYSISASLIKDYFKGLSNDTNE
jgi:uncharacterized phage-associated protein